MSDQFLSLLRCDSCGRESTFDLMDDAHPVFRTLHSFRELIDLTQGQPEPRLALGKPFSCVECRHCKGLAYPVLLTGTDVPVPLSDDGIPLLFRHGQIDAVIAGDHIIIRDNDGDPVLRLRVTYCAGEDEEPTPAYISGIDVDRNLRHGTAFVSL